ncbi:hypothetical protein MTR67_031442 [Solanum verrucosum]|uniref:Uncharacterized protein n=1 Tax=Solanum verrucosum TaxID=315347 RepID=A0AAF0ZEZ4_SOLVR|nr:hypothetical protein MTR67_031442 [Solanum verrucosum]
MSGVSDLVVKECHTTMLINDMDIARLMTHGQHIDEVKLNGRSREKKRSRIDEDKSFHDWFNGHGRSKNRQRFSGQGSSNYSKYKKDKVFNPKPQGTSSESLWCTCARQRLNEEKMLLSETYTLQARGEEGCAPDLDPGDPPSQLGDLPSRVGNLPSRLGVLPSGASSPFGLIPDVVHFVTLAEQSRTRLPVEESPKSTPLSPKLT